MSKRVTSNVRPISIFTRVTEELQAKLQEEATEKEITVSTLVFKILRDHFKKDKN